MDDREEKAAKLAAVHKMEEEERTRRIEEDREEEGREGGEKWENLHTHIHTHPCILPWRRGRNDEKR